MKLYHVDAFTKEIFKGNPAGVCILDDREFSNALLLSIAAELKHSETAFIVIRKGKISLRWFTPRREVDLCGHATLASAHILWEKGYFPEDAPLEFQTASGVLTARRKDDLISIDFPRLSVKDCPPSPLVNEAFGINPVYTGKNDRRYLLEIEDGEQLKTLKPDFEMLKKADLGGFMITSVSSSDDYDFVSRFFAPGVGIPEDPVTGSAHCYLAPYWGKKTGRQTLTGLQASERSGIVKCRLMDDKVELSGYAVTFFETELFI